MAFKGVSPKSPDAKTPTSSGKKKEDRGLEGFMRQNIGRGWLLFFLSAGNGDGWQAQSPRVVIRPHWETHDRGTFPFGPGACETAIGETAANH
jgi:hypothetical protein